MLDDLLKKTDDEVEEAVLESLENIAERHGELLALVRGLHADGRRTLAASIAELMQGEFNGLSERDPAVALWRLRTEWHLDEADFREKSKAIIAEVFRRDPKGSRMVRAAGWDDGLPLRECVARLDKLLGLRPGQLCHHKTWGAGEVKRVDDFYEKVAIDFPGKPGHEFSFAYAAEALTLLEDDHLLAIRMRDPERMAAMLKDSPDEIVRLALSSFGDMPVAILQDLLNREGVVADAKWKSFWDAARRLLKPDATVEIPTKRNERLRLLSKPKAYDEAWAADLVKERDMATVLVRIAEAEEAVGEDGITDVLRDAFANRVAFVLHGATNDDALFALALLTADRLKLSGPGIDVQEGLRQFHSVDAFIQLGTSMHARFLPDLLALMCDQEPETFPALLEDAVPHMTTTLMSACFEMLLERGHEARVAGGLRAQFSVKAATAESLLWVSRRRDRIPEWSLGRLADLPSLFLDAMSVPLAGDRLRARNQLGLVFEDRDWLQECFGDMTTQQRRDTLSRLQSTIGGAPMERGVVCARIINTFPDSQAPVTAAAAAEDGPVAMAGMTSWRRYTERQAELKRLAEVEIPKNSREIAEARSYGDLKENHEYKSAKEMQAILLQRVGDLEDDLRRVQGSEFRHVDTERVAMGTHVRLTLADGSPQAYSVLGEWDRDEELGIISCLSGMAQALAGKRAGDKVGLPSEGGDRQEARVEAVEPLSEPVRAWVRGD